MGIVLTKTGLVIHVMMIHIQYCNDNWYFSMIAAPKKGKSSFQRRISKRMSKVKKNVKSQKECQK